MTAADEKQRRLPPQETDGAGGSHPVFQLRKILVPVDFSKCSEKALRYAIPFARQFGAEVTLLHVIAPVIVSSAGEVPQEGFLQSTEEAQNALDALQGTVGGDIRCKGLVRKGSPHIEIVDTAKELAIDLVILSTHGRTGLEHVLLGSTAAKVVRRAGCPVLIVREHEHEFINVDDMTGG